MSLDCGGNLSTRSKPTLTQGEHANSTQKDATHFKFTKATPDAVCVPAWQRPAMLS